jgi:hypothetical protein
MPQNPPLSWWPPPEWDVPGSSLAPFSPMELPPEPEIVAPPLEVTVPLPEPARMSAPFEPKPAEVTDDTRLDPSNAITPPGQKPRRPQFETVNLRGDSLDDVMAAKRASWERSGASQAEIDGWDKFERARLGKFLGGKSTTAHIGQSTGAIGTIGTMGKDLPSGSALPSDPGQAPEGGWWPPQEWQQKLSPEEEAQIEIDAPRLSADEEAQIEMDDDSRLTPDEEAQIEIDGPPDGRSPEMPDEYLTGEEYGQKLLGMSPEQQEIERAKIEGAKQRFASARALEASEKAMRTAEDNARRYEEALRSANERAVALDKEAQIIANENPMDRISGGRKLAGVLAAVIGGFAAGANGRTTGLDTVNQIAEQAAQQHTQRLALNARQQGAIGDQVARAGDMNRAAEAVRLATYDSAIKTLESEVQNFDPRGSTALRIMDNINQIRAQRAATLAKFRNDELKRAEELLKQQRELLQLQETQRHNMAGEKTAATSAYADLLRAKTDAKKADAEIGADALLTADELRARGVNIPPGVNVPRMSLKQAKSLAETAKSVEDWQKAARENSPEELNRQTGVGELVDTDGKTLRFRGTESAEKVATQKAAGDFMVQLLDRMDTAYQQHGWSSDLLKSPEWQEAQADLNQYILEKKNLDQLGVLAGPDLDLIKGSYGKLDITGMRNPGAGLRRARANTIEKINSTVRAQVASGQKPRRWDPPKPPPPAPKSPQQSSVQSILQFNPKRPTLSESREMGGVGKGAAVDGLPPSYARQIDRMVDVFNSSSASKEEQEQAGAFLEELKNNGSSVVRAYATKAAAAGAVSSIPTGGPQ